MTRVQTAKNKTRILHRNLVGSLSLTHPRIKAVKKSQSEPYRMLMKKNRSPKLGRLEEKLYNILWRPWQESKPERTKIQSSILTNYSLIHKMAPTKRWSQYHPHCSNWWPMFWSRKKSQHINTAFRNKNKGGRRTGRGLVWCGVHFILDIYKSILWLVNKAITKSNQLRPSYRLCSTNKSCSI